jgi:hypothetical protein
MFNQNQSSSGKKDEGAEKQLLRWPKPTKEAQIIFLEYATLCDRKR